MTSTGTVLLIAVPAAVASAASIGLASAVQHRATKLVPKAGILQPGLLVNLIRQPLWLVGIAAILLGLVLQLVALAFGPLIMVQPLLVTAILFGAWFSALLTGQGVDRVIVLGSSACVVGLAAFLLLARPTGTSEEIARGATLLPLVIVFGGIVLACLLVAAHFKGRFKGVVRVGALAVATGVLYGVTAAMMKIVTSQFRSGGLDEPFRHPALYAVCILGPMGFLLSQNTFQQSTLVAPALAVMTIVDPIVGVVIGVAWLGEQIDGTPWAVAGQLLSGLVLAGGVALLARRGTEIRQGPEQTAGQDALPGTGPSSREGGERAAVSWAARWEERSRVQRGR